MTAKTWPPPEAGKKRIYRPWKTCPKTGERLYAKAFGLKAWPLDVDI